MTERFDDEELDRYARQIVLQEVGGVGQARLRAARVLMVGAGGLGCPVALYLVAAGVGTLTLIDDDRVTLGNLHRQILFTAQDVGRPKVEAARAALLRRTPRAVVHAVDRRLSEANARELFAGHDLIIDGSDNFATRSLVADAAAFCGIPLVSGSVQGFEGQLAVLEPFADPASPCLHCLFPETPSPNALPTCAVGGVMGPVAGLLGTLMATEAVKVLLDLEGRLCGRLLLVDGLMARLEPIRVRRRRDCGPDCPKARGLPATA
ncbi:MAG: HesA/MoeB/ThiF family protein [Pseudomonadota bacterium]